MPNGLNLSHVERLSSIHHDIAVLVEELGEATYYAVESETLKRVALDVGVDHTRESTWVIQELGRLLLAERDTNRELRRQVDAHRTRHDLY